MNIKVWDDKYLITSDKLCYTLKEIKTRQSKDDEENSLETQANSDGTYETAIAYHDTVVPYFDQIRYHIDKLELMVDNEMWPLPKYRELLFIR